MGLQKCSPFLLLRARRMLPVHPSMRKGIVIIQAAELFLYVWGR